MTSYPWLASSSLHDDRARIRLFCFPYAGGGVSIFRRWPTMVPPTIEICLVQYPGRETRIKESSYTRIIPLVQELSQAMAQCRDLPFVFWGHSLGGLVAFECARALRKKHRLCPKHLFVSACSAPHVPVSFSPIAGLPEPEFIERLKQLNGTPPEVLVHTELMQLLLPVLRADFEIRETYQYENEPPFDFPITVFGGLQDADVSRERLESWREQTTGSFTVRMVSGDHFFIHSEPARFVHAMVRELFPSKDLAR